MHKKNQQFSLLPITSHLSSLFLTSISRFALFSSFLSLTYRAHLHVRDELLHDVVQKRKDHTANRVDEVAQRIHIEAVEHVLPAVHQIQQRFLISASLYVIAKKFQLPA
jgi:hypothetical protein